MSLEEKEIKEIQGLSCLNNSIFFKNPRISFSIEEQLNLYSILGVTVGCVVSS